MSESSYWYVAVAPLSIPYWPEVTMCETEVGHDPVVAPMLFTTLQKAESKLRELAEAEADAYLQAVDRYGAEDVSEALDNTPELQVFGIDVWLLSEHLKDSAVMHVMWWTARLDSPGSWARS